MSRVFWMVVGAAGGVVAYRRGTQAVARAKELGPLGTAQVAAQATSRLAGRTASGLGRLNDIKAQREGRLVIGSAEDVSSAGRPVPADWVPAPTSAAAATGGTQVLGGPGTSGSQVASGGPGTSGSPGAATTARTTAGATPRTRRLRRDGSARSTSGEGTR